MSVQRDISPDFRDAKICAFLMDNGTNNFSTQDDVISGWLPAGYEQDSAPSRLLHTDVVPVPLRTFIQRQCVLKTPAGRVIQIFDITDPVEHNTAISISSLLLVRRNLPEDLRSTLREAFAKTAIGGSEIGSEIDIAEAALSNAGIQYDDYQVVLYFELRKRTPPEVGRLNFDAFLKQTSSLKDKMGNPAYRVEETEKAKHLCEVPDSQFDEEHSIIVGDVNNPQKEITEAERKKHPECEGLALTDHRIGTLFQYYEWKTEWEVRPIKIGKCRIMRTKIPVIYSRIRKHALWCYAMTDPQVKKNFDKAIVDCLLISAINTAVLAMVTAGLSLSAAALAFSASCFICLETKISDGVKCIFTSLKIVVEKGEWREKVF